MKKKIIIIFIILFIIIGIVVIINSVNKNNISNNNTDALKFKEEYESLNGKKNDSGNKYMKMSIDSNNPIVYTNVKDTIKLLDSDKAIIYIGANWCPWCRNAVPVMLEVAKDLEVDKIYYLNLDKDKSYFELKDRKVVETTHGTDEYYKLLEKLDDHIKDYILKDEEGNEYNVGEKRIYIPYVLVIKNGKIVGDHLATVSLNENQKAYDPLTNEQHDELYDIYLDMFKKLTVSSSTCAIDEPCK